MKFSKLLLAVVATTVLLGAFVSSASARNFSVSEQRGTTQWTAIRFILGLGTTECEVTVSGSLHGRTSGKSLNSLSGYITEATVLRCARGGATVKQPSLPWHRRYRGFTGTLPNITGTSETITGAEWSIREPAGIICTFRRTESGSLIDTYTVSGGTITSASTTSEGSRCEGFEASHSGTTTNITNGSGARITIRLI